MSTRSVTTAFVATILTVPLAAWQSPRWAEGFEGAVLREGRELVVHDRGSGPEILAFGITHITQASVLMVSDGASWRFAPDPPSYVEDAVSVDLGAGPELFASNGGEWVHRLANGVWTTPLSVFYPPTFPQTGNAATTGPVIAWNDGSGPAVYVGGRFLVGVSPAHIIRFDGTAWTGLGTGLDEEVRALEVFDDGTGAGLYAAGAFSNAGGAPAMRIARWRNGVWSAVPGLGPATTINCLRAYDDGGGLRLFAGGSLVVGAIPTQLAAWDGGTWSVIGAPTAVNALTVHDDGGGSALFAAGNGTLRRWRAGVWTPIPLGPADARVRLESYQGQLWITGTFSSTGPESVADVRVWDGLEVHETYGGLGLDDEVFAARVLDVGGGPRLFVGGRFLFAGTTHVDRVAAFDGTHWSSLGSGLNSFVRCFAAYDDGTGTKLFAGGAFDAPVSRIGWFDGVSWGSLGSGISGPFGGSTSVNALAAFDDGSGVQLYAGGLFGTAGGVAVSNVARWNGTVWSAVGVGFGLPGYSSGDVLSFRVYDEGAGPRLFAIGRMTSTGATPLSGVARWDGTVWTPVGTGLPTGTWYAAIVHDDGSGPALYVGGADVRRWNGSTWSITTPGISGTVFAFAVHDDGSGPRLYAGTGNSAASPAHPAVYVWNGTTWSPLAGAPGGRSNERVSALASFDDPSVDPPALFALGRFAGGETVSSFVAKWSRATEDVLVCVGDGTAVPCPCGNASPIGAGAGCLHSFGQGGTLRTSGTADVAGDSLVLLGSAMPATSTALYFQGTVAAASGSGVAFGDGLRCATGSVLRLATVTNSGGASHVPNLQAPTALSVAGAIPAGGTTRIYQVWYRNLDAFCTPAVFNLTNGVRISWRP